MDEIIGIPGVAKVSLTKQIRLRATASSELSWIFQIPQTVLDGYHQPLIPGEGDTVMPVADTKKIATTIPDASLVLIARAAHLAQEE